MRDQFWYRAFGLLICSDLEIPEYRPCAAGEADIVIRTGTLAAQIRLDLETTVQDIRGAHLTEHGMLLHVERVGDFIIRDGCEIDISPLPEVEINLMRLYLIGSVMGTLFHQRGQFIFHGAAVLAQDSVNVFVGPSGAGKSTLTAHLATAGFPVLADDTLPVTIREEEVVAWPGAQVFKMWEDALQGVGETPVGKSQVSRRYGKYFMDNPLAAPDRPAVVKSVYVLEHGDDFSITPLDGLDVITVLNENTYRREFIGFLGFEARYLEQIGMLAGALRFYRFSRPDDPARLPEAVEFLKANWAGN